MNPSFPPRWEPPCDGADGTLLALELDPASRVWLGFCQDGGTWGHVVQHGQVCRREEPPTVITGEGHWEWEGGTGRYAGCYP